MSNSLFGKLVKVMSEVQDVAKSGKHAMGYKYVTEADIMKALKEQLINNKVFVFTSSEITNVVKLNKTDKNGNPKEEVLTVVKTTHTFADADTGDTFEVTSSGTGWDNTDKGAFKAVTGAMKYFGMKNFFIESEDDPENEPGSVQNVGVKKFGAKKPAPTKATKAASKPAPVNGKEQKVVAQEGEVVATQDVDTTPKTVPGKKFSPRKTFVRQ